MAHSLEFAMHHLPALTELSGKRDRKQLAQFLMDLAERFLQQPAPKSALRRDRS